MTNNNTDQVRPVILPTEVKKCYLASGWFSEYGNLVEETLYGFLKADEKLDVYSPRRDGTKLEPGEFHKHELRAKVFADNVNNIVDADIVIANVDSYEGHLDTGTVWEIGYALTHQVPVILYTGINQSNLKPKDVVEKVYEVTPNELFGFDLNADLQVVHSLQDVKTAYTDMLNLEEHSPVFFLVGPTTTEAHRETLDKIKELLHAKGVAYTSVDKFVHQTDLDNPDFLRDAFLNSPTEMLRGHIDMADGVIAVVDDRDPLVSMVIGAAYGMKTPVLSYTDHDYGVNLMLMLSIARHCKGTEMLGEALDVVVKDGFKGLGEHNSEGVRVI